MNKVLSKITKSLLGLSLAFGVAIFTTSNKKNTRVDAGEAVYKTALFGSSYNSLSTNAYDKTWYATNNGFRVDLENFSNNNNGWSYVKCGRKNVESIAYITTHSAIDKAITKVAITVDALTISKINNFTLSTSSDGSSYTKVGDFAKSTGVKTVTLSSPTANLYYKITVDCASGSGNGLMQISKVEYYYESDVSATSLSVGAISTYPGHTANVEVTPNPSGSSLPASLTYISGNESVFTVSNDGVVTGVAAGSATLRVENSSNSSVYGTATVTVNSYPSVDSRITVNGSNKYSIYATSDGSGSTLNYSLTGINNSHVGTVSEGQSSSVNIDYQLSIVSGSYSNTVAFKTSSNQYLGYTSTIAPSGNNYLHLVNSIDDTSSWVVTSEQVILAKTYGQEKARQMRFNYYVNNGVASPRFACYVATSSVSTYIPVSFYEIAAQSLTGISVSNVSIYPAHEKTLSVLPVPAQASLDGATYTFSSATTSVATVDENGVVSAVATGSSVITVTASVGGNDYSTTATVTVQDYPVASGLTLNSSYVITGELESTEYELTGIDTEHNCGIATAVSGSYSKSLVIRPVEGCYTNTIAFEAVDGSGYLKSTKSSSNLTLATKLALNTSWVVSCSNSVFSVISAETYEEATQRHLLLNKNTTNGVANPRFGCYTGVTSSVVNINFLSAEVAVTDFTFSESEVTIYKTQTHTLEVSFTPNNTTDRTLSWSTSDSSVATVSDGVITAVGPGTATISASKSISGNTVTRSCDVTVLNNVPTHAGTSADPYDVNDAVNIAKGLFIEYSNGDPVQTTGAYVRGIVTNLSYKSTSSITFWIGDDLSQTNAATNGFEIYNPSTIMRQTIANRYSSVEEIDEDFAIGTTIVASGDITLYQNTTAEFAAGSNVVLNNRIQAKEYATVFNNRVTNGVCDASGATDPDDLASAWTTVTNSYSSLDLSTKALFLDVAEDGDENGSEIEHCVATYDYILKKYNTTTVTTYTDFMGRVSANIVTLSSSSNKILVNPLFSNENTNLITIIVIISLVSITSIGGYFFIRKRKVN